MTQRSIEELERILTEAQEELKAKQDPNDTPEIATCGECGLSWDDAAVSSVTPTPSGRCPFEYQHEEARELRRLTSEQRLQGQGSKVRTIELKPGQFPEDAYFLTPRERDTVIAALRLWQDRDILKVANDWGRLQALRDIAENGNDADYALDEVEIDILIEENLNA